MVSQGVAVGPGVGETKGGQSGLLPHTVQPGCSFSQSPRCRLVHLKALELLPEPLQELCGCNSENRLRVFWRSGRLESLQGVLADTTWGMLYSPGESQANHASW